VTTISLIVGSMGAHSLRVIAPHFAITIGAIAGLHEPRNMREH
jgi:hypothetical protein